MSEASVWKRHQWTAVSVFVGILLAELLSRSINPTLAWFIGGALFGLVPSVVGPDKKPAPQIIVMTLATGVVAALAHFIVETWL